MKKIIVSAAFIIAGALAASAQFVLEPLPYALDALEPVMGSETLEYHHGKHLKGYVDNLNRLIAGTEFENEPLEVINVTAEGAIYNNGAQVLNHNLFFESLAPVAEAKKAPTGGLEMLINRDFGSFADFKKEFDDQAKAHFGSGWTWLAMDQQGGLKIMTLANAENPIKMGYKPLLGVDVWEHSYYLDYRNDKARYIDRIWEIIDWSVIESRYNEIRDAAAM